MAKKVFSKESSSSGPSEQVTSASKPSNSSGVCGKDVKERTAIQCTDDNDDFRHVSNAKTIASPTTDNDKKQTTAAVLESIEFKKKQKQPSGVLKFFGVLLDDTKIELCSGEYREGKDFENTEETLGKGNIAGVIKVVYDKKKKLKHALKTKKSKLG